jgi:hypothetical protein
MIAAVAGLGVCTSLAAHAAAAEQPNVLVMGEDADEDGVPCSSRVFKSALAVMTEEMHLKGFDTYDETAVTLDTFVQGQCGRTEAEIIDIARSLTRPPIDVITLFSIYASAEELSYTTKIDIRIIGRLVQSPNGRHLGTFEVELADPANAPRNCDRECLLEAIAYETRILARELGAVLAEKLDHLSPTAEPGTESTIVRVEAEAAGQDGLPAAYPLLFEGFTPEEINDIEEYIVAFRGYEHHRPVRCGVRICEYWYETRSDFARLKRNLTVMLDYLSVRGRVEANARQIRVQKIASPESR